jgi:hypothetical protein
MMDWRTGLFIDGGNASTGSNGAFATGTARFRNNIIAGARTNLNIVRSTNVAYTGIANIDSLANTTGLLVNPYNFFMPDYRPAAGSPALANADFTDAGISSYVTPVQAFEKVDYRGAFAPAPTPMWTEGWVEWNPQAAVYPAPTVTISGTASGTWTANNVYELSGVVTVDSLTTLTIEPGTIIRGDNNVPNSCLIVRRGAKLIAQGTPCKPIIFTSDKAPGQRAPGDWGGIIMLGRAPMNATGGVAFIEGLNNIPASQFGPGVNPAIPDESSGVLSYVRIEYGGYVFQQNVEINGLTMGAVGSGTKLDHVQVSFINDDGFEWFGGTVNATHLVCYRVVDDNWDTDLGFSGKIQFALGVRDPELWDPTFAAASGSSTSEGWESDNDAGGSNNNPRTAAVFSNVTDIGPFRGVANPATDLEGFRRGGRIRRNSQTSIFNTIMMDWRTGLFIDGGNASTGSNGAFATGVARFRNNIIAGARTNQNIVRSTNVAYAGIANIDSLANTTGLLIRPYEFFTPDYRPSMASPAAMGAAFDDALLPVVITKFDGETIKNVHHLTWETSTEIENRGFDVERSADGRSFSSIGFVPTKSANGNSASVLSYNFEDSRPLPGISYFRLKQTDINGRSNYSKVLMLQTAVGNDMQYSLVYPNPVGSQLNMIVLAPKATRINVQIVDFVGRAVRTQSFDVKRGSNNIQMNVGNLNSGQYMVKCVDGTQTAASVQACMKK